MLYQLLTDRKPYTIETGTPAEMDRVICTEQPPSPGIGNELDNIILMALRKEPERRYSSVSQFAEDIHRFLDQRPVSARPDTIGYRAGKFVRRNKLSLAAAVLIVIAIAGGTTAALLQARRAQRRFDQVRQLANTSLFEFDESIRDIPGTTASRELIVRTALRYLDSLSAEAGRDLDLKLELAGAYQRVGDVQGSPSMPSLGHEADALESYGKSQKLLEEIVRARPKDAKALRTLVETMLKAGDLEAVSSRKPQAKQSFETAQHFAAQARAAGANDATLEFLGAGASLRLGDLLMTSGLSQARAAYQDALKGYTRANDLQASDRFLNAVAVTLTRLGRIDVFSGNPAGGTESFKKTLAIREDLARRNPASQAYQRFLALTLTDLGDAQGLPVYFNLGDPSGAEQSYLKAQAIQERLAKADPKSVLAKTDLIFLLNRLGAVLLEREPERAKEPLSRVMVLADQLSETSHRQDVQRAVGGAHQRLAAIALAQHRIADGIAEVRTAMEIPWRQSRGEKRIPPRRPPSRRSTVSLRPARRRKKNLGRCPGHCRQTRRPRSRSKRHPRRRRALRANRVRLDPLLRLDAKGSHPLARMQTPQRPAAILRTQNHKTNSRPSHLPLTSLPCSAGCQPAADCLIRQLKQCLLPCLRPRF